MEELKVYTDFGNRNERALCMITQERKMDFEFLNVF